MVKQEAFHDRRFVKLRVAEELDFRPHIIISERQIEAGLDAIRVPKKTTRVRGCTKIAG